MIGSCPNLGYEAWNTIEVVQRFDEKQMWNSQGFNPCLSPNSKDSDASMTIPEVVDEMAIYYLRDSLGWAFHGFRIPNRHPNKLDKTLL